MYKNFLVGTLVASLALIPLSPAMAAGSQQSLGRWVEKVNAQIAARFVRPSSDRLGTARIGFRRASDGRPTDITIIAGQPRVAAAAAATVRRLHDLPPLPAGFASNQMITMNFIAGEPDATYYAQRARMLAVALKSNARLALRQSNTQVAQLQQQ
jgi:hypothetical protein